ncbi:hypothetical protein BU25DRAFT_443435 [Macroventuria anomochaeta]|uniref:Uncharacterized protein n=1 Tax=Macroventuria anomochaeta TaxID=301207 RepID=A0ACB6RLM1_9PLEO|nr:uncharacterized protein BU25DRAFT_443435 [Macroventuria anomochaeta]KAF2622049.1 hypothetical protein BU25DRAFT_443435 [Macroventuria anomochaeta]
MSFLYHVTRVLILSNTHEGSHPWPYTPSRPALTVDVLLHCGDLMQVDGLSAFKKAMSNIRTIDAELKLVGENVEVGDDIEEPLEDHKGCVFYLDEGTHTFTLNDGRTFSIYASLYTPAFGDYAFTYGDHADRFNAGANPVLADVDIIMLHGPPAFPAYADYTLDTACDGRHCGCEKLAKVVKRAQPKLHCFEHNHEGRGAVKMSWGDERLEEVSGVKEDAFEVVQVKKYRKGETMLVNAAMFGEDKEWIDDMKV